MISTKYILNWKTELFLFMWGVLFSLPIGLVFNDLVFLKILGFYWGIMGFYLALKILYIHKQDFKVLEIEILEKGKIK